MDLVESIKSENAKAEKGLDEWYGLSSVSIDQINAQIDELLDTSNDQLQDEEQLKRVMGSIRGDVAGLAARHKSLHGLVFYLKIFFKNKLIKVQSRKWAG